MYNNHINVEITKVLKKTSKKSKLIQEMEFYPNSLTFLKNVRHRTTQADAPLLLECLFK